MNQQHNNNIKNNITTWKCETIK